MSRDWRQASNDLHILAAREPAVAKLLAREIRKLVARELGRAAIAISTVVVLAEVIASLSARI